MGSLSALHAIKQSINKWGTHSIGVSVETASVYWAAFIICPVQVLQSFTHSCLAPT